MITLRELNPKGYELTSEQEENLPVLHERVNRLRTAYDYPMIVSSGVRSVEHHRRIYAEKAKRLGVENIRVPMGSQHLKGAAVDIYDPDQRLQRWILNNTHLLEEYGLWCEDFNHTKTWVHFQIYPPRSGKRFFIP